MVRASRRDGASSKENSLNSNAAREAPTYGGAVQSNGIFECVERYLDGELNWATFLDTAGIEPVKNVIREFTLNVENALIVH